MLRIKNYKLDIAQKQKKNYKLDNQRPTVKFLASVSL